MIPEEYLAETKARLVASAAVTSIDIVEERALPDRGYFRARLRLSNDDFLEIAEYWIIEDDRCVTQRYRYQWMDELQQVLRKRWDNVEHFPDLSSFPHHVHVGEESNVEPGRVLSIMDLIDLIEEELEGDT